MFCLDLGHRQWIPSLELAQHISAADVAGFSYISSHEKIPSLPTCFPAFPPRKHQPPRFAELAGKEVRSCMKPSQVCQDLPSVFPRNSSGKRIQPCLLPTGKWGCASVWGHDSYSQVCFAGLQSLAAMPSVLDELWSQSTQGALWGPIFKFCGSVWAAEARAKQ